jgi:hypothetical protein
VVKFLPLVQSDHTPLVLYSHKQNFHTNFPIHFEKYWLQQHIFIDLFMTWWNSYILPILDIGEYWRLKLYFIRKKLRGWSLNLKAET